MADTTSFYTLNAMNCLDCTNTNCLIKKHSLNANLNESIARKHEFKCKKGQHFVLEGAPVHGLFFIQNGKVKVSKTGIHGKEQIVRLCTNGEVIGHRGFGTGQTYPIGAVAIEDATLCNFTNDMMKEMLRLVPALTYDFMLFYADELNKSETKVRKFAQMTVREKVIDSFLYINRKFGQTDGYLNIGLSRKDIADFAGTTEEQVIRIISSLKKENLIRASGKKLGIVDLELLKSEIDEHNFFLHS